MSEKPENPSAFPPHGAAFDFVGVETGMTLRDWFAGQRLIGISQHYDPGMAAKAAYQFADAMLTERTKP